MWYPRQRAEQSREQGPGLSSTVWEHWETKQRLRVQQKRAFAVLDKRSYCQGEIKTRQDWLKTLVNKELEGAWSCQICKNGRCIQPHLLGY